MLPNLLAFDVSTDRGLVALHCADGSLHVAEPGASKQHARTLVPCIANLLNRCGMRLEGLDAVAVGVGPGSFTGLRVGLSVAKTLCYAAGLRLIGISSLGAIGLNLGSASDRAVVVAEAQQGAWFVYRPVRGGGAGAGGLDAGLTVEPTGQVYGSLEPGQILIGPALQRARARGEVPAGVATGSPDDDYPQAAALLRLTLAAYEEGVRHDPLSLEPIYLRASAAEEKAGASRR